MVRVEGDCNLRLPTFMAEAKMRPTYQRFHMLAADSDYKRRCTSLRTSLKSDLKLIITLSRLQSVDMASSRMIPRLLIALISTMRLCAAI